MNTRVRAWLTALPLGAASPGCGGSQPANLVRVRIGPEGGLISSHDDVVTIVLQPGTLARATDIEIFPSDEPPVIFGPAYRVRPDIDLSIDAEVTYRRVFPIDRDGLAVAAIKKADYEAQMGHWRALPTLAIDEATEEIIATDDQLSLYYGMTAHGGQVADGSGGDDGGPGGSGTDEGTTTEQGGSTLAPGSTSLASTTDGADEGPAGCGDGDAMAGEICFAPAVDFNVGASPRGVVLADLDGDGDQDVATANFGAGTLSIRLGDGTGALAAEDTLPIAAGPTSLVAADLDDDGDEDIVVAAYTADAVVLVASNGGAFAVQDPNMVGDGPVDLDLVRLDEDDLLDVVVVTAGSAEIYTFVTTPAGLGATGSVALGMLTGQPTSVVASTFNDLLEGAVDGDAFAFAAGRFQGFDGNGLGGLIPGGIAGDVGDDIGRGWAGDLGGNAHNDIVVVDRGGGGVIPMIGNGMAAFDIRPLVATGNAPSDVVVADVTGDGDPDIVVANAGDDTVTIVERTGAMAWRVGATLDVGASPAGIDVGDLNGDGVLDIVVCNEDADTITVLLSDP